jgi:hypothetical protein
MNPKNTWLWVIAAAGMFAAIFLYDRFKPKPETGPAKLLPGLDVSAVASVEILPANQPAIHADRTNGLWRLTQPVSYPAQSASIENLLAALEQLVPVTRISAQELSSVRDTDKKFGFNPPPTTLILQPGDQHIQIGNKNGPGDQMFVKIVGVDGVFVVDTDLLRFIPRSTDDWRDAALVDFARFDFDRLVVTNGAKVLALQCNPTNQIWRMVFPMDARADGIKVGESLQKLRNLRTTQFVDVPITELDSFGLQTPELSLEFKRGTNTALFLAVGKSPTNDPGRVYARRNDEKTVVTIARDLLEPWRASYETLRDHHLVSPTGPLSAIEIHARDDFTLLRTNNAWLITPQNYPGDTALISELLRHLAGLQIAPQGFVKDVVVAPDLPALGLAVPSYQIILHATATNTAAGATNIPIARIDFGTNQNDLILARRADEDCVYGVKLEDFQRLPATALQLRERRIWHFLENDVARITIQQAGKTLQFDRKGTNQWSLAPGSQGMINEFALEETVHRLGELAAETWVERGDQNRARYGFKPDGHRISVELKTGETLGVELGGDASLGSPYALVKLGDEPWIFEFPPVLYQFVQLYLTIRPGPP